MEAFKKAVENYLKDGNVSNGTWMSTCAERAGLSQEEVVEYITNKRASMAE